MRTPLASVRIIHFLGIGAGKGSLERAQSFMEASYKLHSLRIFTYFGMGKLGGITQFAPMNPSQTWLERPLMPSQTASYPSPSMVNYAKFYMAMGLVAFFLLPFAFLLLFSPFSLAIQACQFSESSIFKRHQIYSSGP